MKMELPDIRPEERTPLVDALLAIIRELLDRNQQLEASVQQLRDEIAVLKGQKPRPKIKPSSLESATPPSQQEGTQKESPSKRPGSEKRSKNSELTIHRRLPLHIDDLPAGAAFKGYEDYLVQELEINSQNTLYLRARYQLLDGSSVLAALPATVIPGSHFGPTLTSYILHQYHNGVTQPLLLEQLHDFGVDISTGQLERMLTQGKEDFHQEKADLLQAGLEVSSYIGVDDTGARHQGRNGYCTVIGNDWFASFESTLSKSRLNFLEVLQGRQRDYVINQAARDYWEKYQIPAALVEKLSQGPPQWLGEPAWQAPSLGTGDHGRASCATGHGRGVVGRPGGARAVAGLEGTQRRRRPVCGVRACQLLDPHGTAVASVDAIQRRTPCGYRDGAADDLGILPRAEGLSAAALCCPEADSGSPL
jgi:hypothetical protein